MYGIYISETPNGPLPRRNCAAVEFNELRFCCVSSANARQPLIVILYGFDVHAVLYILEVQFRNMCSVAICHVYVTVRPIGSPL